MVYNYQLTEKQVDKQALFREFVTSELIPVASRVDREEHIPVEVIKRMIEHRLWGTDIPQEYGGVGLDAISYGLLNEEIGSGCSNVRNMVGVQGMVSNAILKWGTKEQKQHWLPRMASGEIIGAFALTEPDIGSDAKNIVTSAVKDGTDYIITGKKKWITLGQNANLFLVFAQSVGKVGAFLLESGQKGFTTEPMNGLVGLSGSMLAELKFDSCRVPKENVIGKVGFGLTHVANYGLSYGRYSTAWGCVGLARACLDASIHYTETRKQFETFLKDHQLIKKMIADMMTNTEAARLLCIKAGHLLAEGNEKSIMETSVAKYFASTIAFKAATDAVQIHGANGCRADYPVERFMRDAKILEIVEGSTQIQQILIARYARTRK